MPRIFISYRRDDTAPYAGRLFADLADHFQRGDLIMDIDSIAPGENFGQFIREEVGSCDVLLALIGKRWLTIRDSRRRRRLDDPEDFVRIEIGTALARDIRVVPVLLGGARVPNPARLPPDLQALSQRQAVEITDARWNYDVGRLIEALGATVDPVPRPLPDAQPDTRFRLVRDARVISAGVVVLILAAAALIWQLLQWTDPGAGVRTDGQPTAETRVTEAPSPPSLAVAGTTEPAASPTPVPGAVASPLVSTPSPIAQALASPAPNPSATATKAAPTCTTALSPDGTLTYNPDTAAKLQSVNWSAAGASTLWALRSIGCEIAEEDLYDLMVPRYISPELGLLDASGAGLARLLSVDLGLRAQSQPTITFDEVVARAGSQPIIIGPRRWTSVVSHWVAVRRVEDGALVLMNPAQSDGSFGQVTLDREAFNARAPVSAVWIELPPPPTPTPRPPPPTQTPRRAF